MGSVTNLADLTALPPELLTQILLDLPVTEILRLCRISTRLHALCQSPAFWADKAHHDFNYPPRQFLHNLLGLPVRRYRWVQNLYHNPNAALISAVIRGSEPDVDYLLTVGATDVNRALAVAAARGQRLIMELLLNHGATQVDEAIKQASRNNHGDIIKWLYQRGCNLGQPIDLNQALWEATRHGFASLVIELIHLGATDVDRALVAAASRPDTHLLDIIMTTGAPGITLNGINRALVQAATYGNSRTTRYLIEHGATDLAAAARMATTNHQDNVAHLIRTYQHSSG